uniref:Uncharacterized protein n=1 Tax=Magallana gigas TaxID=29159 RepID=A0A8W8I9B9_MAGGI
MKELQDQLEAEQLSQWCIRGKTQVKELKEDVEEKGKQYQDAITDLESVQQDKSNEDPTIVYRLNGILCAQLQLAMAKADSENLARSIERTTDGRRERKDSTGAGDQRVDEPP